MSSKKPKARIVKNWLISIFAVVLISGIGILIWGCTDSGSQTMADWFNADQGDIRCTCLGAVIGFGLGLTFLLWYPISRLVAWSKTRTLKNQNLAIDLKIKEQHLSNLQNGTTTLPTNLGVIDLKTE